MKNIAIFGSTRSGKSTLAKMISKKYSNYHIIIGDDIWTYNRTNEEILYHSKYWIPKSKEHQEECKRLNIWYVDTSFDREKVLNDTLKKIEKKILE